jgi:hypothetical protein
LFSRSGLWPQISGFSHDFFAPKVQKFENYSVSRSRYDRFVTLEKQSEPLQVTRDCDKTISTVRIGQLPPSVSGLTPLALTFIIDNDIDNEHE